MTNRMTRRALLKAGLALPLLLWRASPPAEHGPLKPGPPPVSVRFESGSCCWLNCMVETTGWGIPSFPMQ